VIELWDERELLNFRRTNFADRISPIELLIEPETRRAMCSPATSAGTKDRHKPTRTPASENACSGEAI
jgi:hypothetical protein